MPFLRRRPVLELVLYSKSVCPLCDRLKEALARVEAKAPHRLEVVSIDGDKRHRYALKVPVLELDGRELVHGKVSDDELLAALRAAQTEARS